MLVGVTLLHIWAWEHIVVLKPVVVLVDVDPNEPMVFFGIGGRSHYNIQVPWGFLIGCGSSMIW